MRFTHASAPQIDGRESRIAVAQLSGSSKGPRVGIPPPPLPNNPDPQPVAGLLLLSEQGVGGEVANDNGYSLLAAWQEAILLFQPYAIRHSHMIRLYTYSLFSKELSRTGGEGVVVLARQVHYLVYQLRTVYRTQDLSSPINQRFFK